MFAHLGMDHLKCIKVVKPKTLTKIQSQFKEKMLEAQWIISVVDTQHQTAITNRISLNRTLINIKSINLKQFQGTSIHNNKLGVIHLLIMESKEHKHSIKEKPEHHCSANRKIKGKSHRMQDTAIYRIRYLQDQLLETHLFYHR